MQDKLKLFLGCGPSPIHPQHLEYVDGDWIKIDKYVKEPGIVAMDIRKLEFSPESVSDIYCSHALEHLGLWEVIPTLREWNRVLVHGGKLTINVPDISWALEHLIRLENPETNESAKAESKTFYTPRKVMEIIYGNQDHDGEYHKSGYTVRMLKDYLEEAGFQVDYIESVFEAHDMFCVIAQATKL